MSGCFHLDTLSNILGKSRSDIKESISGFCPHFSSWRNRIRASTSFSGLGEEEFEKVFLNARAGLHKFNGYDESCSDWALRIERSGSKDRVARTTNPTVLPLTRVSLQGATPIESRSTYIPNKSELVHKVEV